MRIYFNTSALSRPLDDLIRRHPDQARNSTQE